MKYEKMSVEQLEKKVNDLSDKAQAIREEMREVQRVISDRQNAEAAEAKIANMSDGEKAALAQALSVAGIESEESVQG